MRAIALVVLVVSGLGLAAGCGGRPGGPAANPSMEELDKRHCTNNSDCASGLCSNGRCG